MKIDVNKVSVIFHPVSNDRLNPQYLNGKYYLLLRIQILKENLTDYCIDFEKVGLTIEQCQLINNILIDKNQALLNKTTESSVVLEFVKLKIESLLDVIPFTNFEEIKQYHEHKVKLLSLSSRISKNIQKIGRKAADELPF